MVAWIGTTVAVLMMTDASLVAAPAASLAATAVWMSEMAGVAV